VLPASGPDHRPRDPVEDDEAILAVLHPRARDDEDRRTELGDRYLPVPLQAADLRIPTSGVHRKQRHLRQMFGSSWKRRNCSSQLSGYG
jgi:hypothetical protein